MITIWWGINIIVSCNCHVTMYITKIVYFCCIYSYMYTKTNTTDYTVLAHRYFTVRACLDVYACVFIIYQTIPYAPSPM